MMRIAAMLVVLTSVAGCAQYDAAREANLAAATQEKVAADEAACRASGQPGTPQYDDCRKRLANEQARETRGHQRLMDQMTNQNNLRPIGQ
jgi:hypothetical protein